LSAWLGLLCGAFVKYLILYSTARLLLPAAIGADIADRFIAIMSLPQFFTAVIGGALAFVIFSMLRVRFRL
jgi:hypothetical protein